MKLVLQRSRHTEISASAANRPKKIWIGVLAGLDLPPICRDKLRRYQVVARGAVLRHQQSLSSAQRQAGNSYSRATAQRRCQTEALRGAVQVAYQRTCSRPRNALAGVDVDPVHCGEIDDYAVIADAEPGSVVASATYREW